MYTWRTYIYNAHSVAGVPPYTVSPGRRGPATYVGLKFRDANLCMYNRTYAPHTRHPNHILLTSVGLVIVLLDYNTRLIEKN